MIKKLKIASIKSRDILVLNDKDKNVKDIQFNFPGKNVINFNDGTLTEGVCIGCDLKPCLNYTKEEIDVQVLDGMPYNNDRRVCPSNAIKENDEGKVDITPNLCINCGICFSKCASAGIFYNSEIKAFDVNHTTDDSFKIINSLTDPLVEHTSTEFTNSINTISIINISTGFANNFVSKFKSLNAGFADLELILVRNLLFEAGINNKVSAKGNNDLRLDFIGVHSDKFFPGESELLGSDILGLPRRILEGVAWMHSRKKIHVQNQIPCVMILEFPRKRSDFYEVISDIENITDVKIKTLSIYFLSIINLFRIKLSVNDLNDYFSINKESQDYGVYFKAFIDNIEEIDENYGSELYTFSK